MPISALPRTAVSIVPRKNSRRVMLIACEKGKVSVMADIPIAKKYQSGACPPPPYIGSADGPSVGIIA